MPHKHFPLATMLLLGPYTSQGIPTNIFLLQQCLDETEPQGHRLKRGIGCFWDHIYPRVCPTNIFPLQQCFRPKRAALISDEWSGYLPLGTRTALQALGPFAFSAVSTLAPEPHSKGITQDHPSPSRFLRSLSNQGSGTAQMSSPRILYHIAMERDTRF